MMKRLFSILFVFVLVLSFPINAFATNIHKDESIIYLDDGSYITVTIEEQEMRATGSKTGKKNITYTASSGTVCWIATLTGTFNYTGTTSTCTSASCSVTVYESNWYTVSKSATKNGNTATATVTMGRKVLGITIDKDTYTTTLSCDKNGNLS